MPRASRDGIVVRPRSTNALDTPEGQSLLCSRQGNFYFGATGWDTKPGSRPPRTRAGRRRVGPEREAPQRCQSAPSAAMPRRLPRPSRRRLAVPPARSRRHRRARRRPRGAPVGRHRRPHQGGRDRRACQPRARSASGEPHRRRRRCRNGPPRGRRRHRPQARLDQPDACGDDAAPRSAARPEARAGRQRRRGPGSRSAGGT